LQAIQTDVVDNSIILSFTAMVILSPSSNNKSPEIMILDTLKSIGERNTGNDSDDDSFNSAVCDLYEDVLNRFSLRKSESFSTAFSADHTGCVSSDLRSIKRNILPQVINVDGESYTSSFLLSSGSIDDDMSYGTEFTPEDRSYLPVIMKMSMKNSKFGWDATPNYEDTEISSSYVDERIMRSNPDEDVIFDRPDLDTTFVTTYTTTPTLEYASGSSTGFFGTDSL